MEPKTKKYEKINFDDVEVYNASANDIEADVDYESNDNESDLKEEFKPVMTEREIGRIKNTITSMTEDEKDIVLSTIPSEKLWSELRRRNVNWQSKIDTFNEIMGVSISTVNPIPESSWIGMVDRYSDIEVRFNEIARVMGV
jgi:hypothetical protein